MFLFRFKNHKSVAVFLVVLSLLFSSSAFGQSLAPGIILSDDKEIFPFESIYSEDSDSRYTETDYSEDLYEVTDAGVVDSEGNYVDTAELEALDADEGDAFDAVDEFLDETQSVPQLSAFEAYRDSIILNWGGKRLFTERRLEGIRENLTAELKNFEVLERSIGKIERNLEPIHQEIETLKQQIQILNDQLIESNHKIKNTELQIVDKQITIRDLMWDIQRSETELAIQQEIVLEYIVLVYQEEEKYLDLYDDGSSTLKLLLADASVSENLQGREYLRVLEVTGREVFYDLFKKRNLLDEKRLKVQIEESKLQELYISLNHERRLLGEGRLTKKTLLEKTRGEEEEFQKLLDESIQQRLQSAIAIQNMQENVLFIEDKLTLLDESLERVETIADDPDRSEEFELLDDVVDEVTDEYYEGPTVDPIPRNQAFIWPIPAVAVTAYYNDPTYPKKWGEHYAVDLRAKHFTEIVAPANAYVFQTKDNGMGYSYIILAHKNRLMTVYGHVSEILVKPGTVVKQGDVIGLTGATPGTKGAGWQTTGPHLHFEVYHNGKHVDPLDYLPVFELPIEYIPNKYLTN